MEVDTNYTRYCEHCGEPYHKFKAQSKANFAKRRFCSQKCFGIVTGIAQRTLKDINCLNCKKLFRPSDSKIRYCSLTCAAIRNKDRRGANHPSWKGGRTIGTGGYIRILLDRNHPFYGKMGNKHRYIFEHRVVMAELLRRPLEDYETVHHKDGNPANNAIANLELRTSPHGRGATKHCPTCTCGQP